LFSVLANLLLEISQPPLLLQMQKSLGKTSDLNEEIFSSMGPTKRRRHKKYSGSTI